MNFDFSVRVFSLGFPLITLSAPKFFVDFSQTLHNISNEKEEKLYLDCHIILQYS